MQRERHLGKVEGVEHREKWRITGFPWKECFTEQCGIAVDNGCVCTDWDVFCLKGNRFFVAADDNAVQAYLLKEGEPDGLIVRFTAHATHICINSAGTMLISGAR